MGVVNKVYNFSAFTHAQNFAVESWWTYQIDLSKSTKQNIVVILQAQQKNLNTVLGWPEVFQLQSMHVYPCYSIRPMYNRKQF